MKTIHLGKQNSIFNHFIREIRDVKIQNDAMRFRRNIERIGEIFAYEISKEMEYKIKKITTPLGICSDNCFISAYRKHKKGGDFEVKIEYMSSPNLEDKTIILCDPMLASGSSMILAMEAIMSKGKPKHIHIVAVIASAEGVDYVKENIPMQDCTLWLGAMDQEMTAQSYIVPGLGDAGDLAFGEKS